MFLVHCCIFHEHIEEELSPISLYYTHAMNKGSSKSYRECCGRKEAERLLRCMLCTRKNVLKNSEVYKDPCRIMKSELIPLVTNLALSCIFAILKMILVVVIVHVEVEEVVIIVISVVEMAILFAVFFYFFYYRSGCKIRMTNSDDKKDISCNINTI